MVRIEVTSPQPSDAQGHVEEPPPRLAGNRDRSLMVLDFPDVIKSAESSPRHSLIPLTEFYEAQGRTLDERRTREIINQINTEVAQAINRGQSPYFIYGISDNDEETWCWSWSKRYIRGMRTWQLFSCKNGCEEEKGTTIEIWNMRIPSICPVMTAWNCPTKLS